MTEKYIRFQKQRDLGEIITDTFKFLRQNYKLLFRLIAGIAGPAFLIMALLLGYYSFMMGKSLINPFNQNFDNYNTSFFLTIFLLLISFIVFYALLYNVVFTFIKSYIRNRGHIDEDEVALNAKKNFTSMFGLFLVVGIFLFFGFLLIIPGIYLWVPLSLAPAVLLFENRGIGGSLEEVFRIVSKNWWMTFLSLVLIYLLVQVISMIFRMPLFLYYFMKALSMTQEGATVDPTSLFDWVYVVLNIVASLIQHLLSVIMIVAVSFIYFNLHEKKYATGSMEEIEQLGRTNDE